MTKATETHAGLLYLTADVLSGRQGDRRRIINIPILHLGWWWASRRAGEEVAG